MLSAINLNDEPLLQTHEIGDVWIERMLTAKPMAIEYALSNSFGFGGTNASVVFKKVT